MSDTISRQAAIDAVAEGLKRTFVEYRDVAEKMLNKVPSAQPEMHGTMTGFALMQKGETMLTKKRKKQITITIDEDLYNLIKVFSLKTSLTVSSTINLFLRRAFNETRA